MMLNIDCNICIDMCISSLFSLRMVRLCMANVEGTAACAHLLTEMD